MTTQYYNGDQLVSKEEFEKKANTYYNSTN